MSTPTQEKARQLLKRYFGYEHFRPMQADIIQAVMDGKDSLVLMPTGGGKSVCYQIPALALPGTGIVVSPLISLMKDQVEGLKNNGVKAAFLNSSLTVSEQRQVEDDLFYGKYDLIYISPEKLLSAGFIPLLRKMEISLFAIDEAHCISSWGHDFRPEYTQMQFLKREFPQTPIIALTATADKLTRKDIVDQLQLSDPQIFISSFDRPNLSLEVRPGQKRIEQIIDFIEERPKQAGIIYCLSRKATEELAAKLQQKGIRAGYYHARLEDRQRSEVQEAFLNDKLQVISATIAFGMGIDKSNVRWVIHYNLPMSIENYYQEIGRAGRDGAKADTLMFYSFRDVQVLKDIMEEGSPEHREIRLNKLERMQQFAEAPNCRRRILLNYFGEHQEGNCGNCDNCKHPPAYFDGTEIAQKALSAVYRVRESVGINLLIDILRGSGRKEILANGYHTIKTYGAGREFSSNDWQHFLMQLLHLGYIEIAHDKHQAVQLTPASQPILFGQQKVQLARRPDFVKVKEDPKTTQQKTVRARQDDELFERLRQMRAGLARSQGIPPYLIFTDATLEELAAQKPATPGQLRKIPGIGDSKMERYGELVLNEILIYQQERPKPESNDNLLRTFDYYRQSLPLESIARERNLSLDTIVSHLVQLKKQGLPVDLNRYVSEEELEMVAQAVKAIGDDRKLKPIYQHLEERLPYHAIRMALAMLKQHS